MHPTQKPAGVPEPTPADALRHAALYLQRYGWIRDSFFMEKAAGAMPSACAVGAVRAAIYGNPAMSDSDDQSGEVFSALRLLADHLGLGSDLNGEPIDFVLEGLVDEIAGWNDDRTRTADQVIASMTTAAGDYDASAAAFLAWHAAKGTTSDGAE